MWLLINNIQEKHNYNNKFWQPARFSTSSSGLFPQKKWVGREKALASTGHVYSLNIPEKQIFM